MARRSAYASPGAYYLAIYGEPHTGSTWGWRLEGHHLSIHATLVDGTRLVVAPTFLGASPTRVDGDFMNGAQVLAREEELGFRLLASLDGEQRKAAVVRPSAPADILTGPGDALAPIPGLAAARMTAAQRRLLEQIVDEATAHLPPEIAARERGRVVRGGRASELVFSWAGGARPGQPHYYRVAGPTFLYELDNTQEGATHVHSVWHARDEAGGDFGEDLLREHLASPAHAGLSPQEQAMLAEIRGAWSRGVAPRRVLGNVYYVGAAKIAVYLIHTSAGLILIDAGTREMGPVVRAGVVALGFKVEDVKLILVSHAHFDHVEGLAALKKLTGGSVAAIAQEVPAISTGKDLSALGALGWEPVAVDRVLRDGEEVTLGDTTLRVVWMPGHTQGATSYTTTVVEEGKKQEVLFLAAPAANAGVKLVGNPRHLTIAEDLAHTHAALRRLSPDVVLTFHPEGQELLDRAAFRRLVDEAEADTQRRLAAERAAQPR